MKKDSRTQKQLLNFRYDLLTKEFRQKPYLVENQVNLKDSEISLLIITKPLIYVEHSTRLMEVLLDIDKELEIYLRSNMNINYIHVNFSRPSCINMDMFAICGNPIAIAYKLCRSTIEWRTITNLIEAELSVDSKTGWRVFNICTCCFCSPR